MSGASSVSSRAIKGLKAKAMQAASNSYSPYSRFAVGAAVLMSDGRTYVGCNVENVSLGLTICAERSAVFQAIVCGGREVKAVAIFAGRVKPTPPCGACRQVIGEFGPTAQIFGFSRSGTCERWSMMDLLPTRPDPRDLRAVRPRKRR